MKIIIALWLLFFISHSVLAASSVKSFFENKLKMTPPQYRLLFNGVAAVLIVAILFYLIKTPSDAVFSSNHFVFGVGCGFVVASLWVLTMAFKNINLSSFLGLSAADESTGLITEGVFKVVRHPIYLGVTILLVGVFLISPTWTVAVSLVLSIVYIAIGIEFEERKLRKIFGTAYDDFARGKKKFIPFVY
jgi:methanethiol S-methyltransferase